MPSDAPQAEGTLPARLASEPLRFTGNGAEYFRIWIVNLALTIVTLGIYSAWAKVRRLQYFYRNTQLAGSGFDYHGRPGAILKGRLIAGGLFVGSNIVGEIDPMLGLVATIPVMAVLPWLLVRSFAFRLHNSSWRGLRFRFLGSVREGYRVFLLWPFLAVLTLGLLWPKAHRELKAFQHNHGAFGTAQFTFGVGAKPFYGAYVRTTLLFVLAPLAVVAIMLMLGGGGAFLRSGASADPVILAGVVLVSVAAYIVLLASGPYLAAQIQNLVWNGTALGPHRFECRIQFGRLFGIVVTNLLLTIVTLGLYRPFAVVRLTRYRVECMTLVPGESLDTFVGTQAREVEALGEEMSEFLDIDIAM